MLSRHHNPIITHVLFCLILLVGSVAQALDINGNGNQNGVQVLYLFNEASGTTVVDSMPSPLNLTVINPQNTQRETGAISLNAAAGIRSSTPATKIVNACRASNELTVEAWIESYLENDRALPAYGPARIISLSNGVDVNGGFYLGQGYDGGHFYVLGLNSRQVVMNNALVNQGPELMTDPTNSQIVNHSSTGSRLQHVVITKNSAGLVRFYVSDKNGVPILRGQQTLNASFAGWNANYVLTLGNDARFDNDSSFPLLSNIPNAGNRTIQDKDWQGKFHMVAVYCRALSENEVLAQRAPTNWISGEQNFTVDLNKPITPARQLAQTIYRRIASYNIPVDHPVLDQMETALSSDPNDINNRVNAARIATAQPGFYNRTVKDFAKRMSNREHEVAVPFNDFSAMIVGATRDELDARELLRGDFYYRGRADRTATPSDLIADFHLSNSHFEALENLNYDLQLVLERVNGQTYYNGVDRTVPAINYDSAGLLTTRAFLSAHAIAGTNRRLVEFAFSEFLCRPLNQWADNTAPDSYVGRDVDRFPTGDHTKYQTSCRGCHGQMDGLRGAFARITFEQGFVKHAWVMNPDPETDPNEANNNDNPQTMVQVPRGIAGKFNRDNTVFSGGIEVIDSSWINYANRGANATYFGWKTGTLSGRGIREFGNMIAESQAFPDCMTRRAFRAVCKRDPQTFDENMIVRVRDSFKTTDNYSLKKLFERVAVQPECLGE